MLRHTGLLVVAAVVALAVLIEPAAAQQSGGFEGRIEGMRGGGTVTQQRTRDDGASTRTRTFQGDQGRTATQERNRSWDRESGTASGQQTTTLRDGRTITRESNAVRNEDGSWTATGSRTGANGNTATGTSNVWRGEDGSINRERTTTDAEGNVRTRTGNTVRTDTGSVSSGTYTNKDGETGSYQLERSRGEDSYTIDRSTTGADGTTRGNSTNYTRDGNTITRSRN